MSHTPGEWLVGGTVVLGAVRVFAPDRACEVAVCPQQGEENGEHVANAHLIAAAPDLLAACERSLARLEFDLADGEYDCTCAAGDPCELHGLRAAIAKARGEP